MRSAARVHVGYCRGMKKGGDLIYTRIQNACKYAVKSAGKFSGLQENVQTPKFWLKQTNWKSSTFVLFSFPPRKHLNLCFEPQKQGVRDGIHRQQHASVFESNKNINLSSACRPQLQAAPDTELHCLLTVWLHFSRLSADAQLFKTTRLRMNARPHFVFRPCPG